MHLSSFFALPWLLQWGRFKTSPTRNFDAFTLFSSRPVSVRSVISIITEEDRRVTWTRVTGERRQTPPDHSPCPTAGHLKRMMEQDRLTYEYDLCLHRYRYRYHQHNRSSRVISSERPLLHFKNGGTLRPALPLAIHSVGHFRKAVWPAKAMKGRVIASCGNFQTMSAM